MYAILKSDHFYMALEVLAILVVGIPVSTYILEEILYRT